VTSASKTTTALLVAYLGVVTAGCGDAARQVAPVAPVETVAIPAVPAPSGLAISTTPPTSAPEPPASSSRDSARSQPATSDEGETFGDVTSGVVGGVVSSGVIGGTSTGCAPFNRGAAAQALGAVDLRKCRQANGPTGAGHIKITYEAASGRVKMLALDAGPFVGTPEGACIVARFRSAAVPPFCGTDVSVGKSFAIP
jgi:hypothetical protein